MGCNCGKKGKGIPNRAYDKALIKEIYKLYKLEIDGKTIQYFTSEQRQLVIDWYMEIYHNSKEVDYKTANAQLNKLFDQHKVR